MNWGILATGSIAKTFAKTVNAMNSNEEKLLGVASRKKEVAESFAKEFKIPKSYGSYKELCEDDEIDAVYIATPNNLHFENAMLALDCKKNVLVEKPFTTNAKDAQTLYDTAKEKGLFIMEAFWIRFLPLYKKLLEIIESNKYGKLIHARCDYGFIASGARRERKFKSELAGGALLDIGIYNLGFLCMIMKGLPKDFSSKVHFNEYGTDDFSAIQFEFSGERSAHSTQSIGLQIERQAALFFEKASIYIPDFQKAFSLTIKPNDGESMTLDFPPEVNGYEYEIQEVTRCVKNKELSSKIFTPEDSVALISLLDKIRQSWKMKFSFE